MNLSLKTDYSLRLLLFLAAYEGELIPVARVAAEAVSASLFN